MDGGGKIRAIVAESALSCTLQPPSFYRNFLSRSPSFNAQTGSELLPAQSWEATSVQTASAWAVQTIASQVKQAYGLDATPESLLASQDFTLFRRVEPPSSSEGDPYADASEPFMANVIPPNIPPEFLMAYNLDRHPDFLARHVKQQKENISRSDEVVERLTKEFASMSNQFKAMDKELAVTKKKQAVMENVLKAVRADNASQAAKIDVLATHNQELLIKVDIVIHENTELKKKLRQQGEEFDAKLSAETKYLREQNKNQEETLKAHTATIVKLTAENAELTADNKKRDVTIALQGARLTEFSGTIFALHRRVVLDDAQWILMSRYNIKFADFQAPRFSTFVEGLVKALSAEDRALLTSNEITMIFSRGSDTIRSRGNEAAHTAPPEQMADAVLGSDLTESDRGTLIRVFQFATGREPKLM